MSQLAPSILAADFNHLGKQIQQLEQNQIKLLHIDVMDGVFVPSISFGMPLITSIRKESRLFFDVHLMVQEPSRYIKEFVEAGADLLTVHVEACKGVTVSETLKKIKEHNIKCGVSLNPETSIEKVLPYLDLADLVLVMSVHPGFGGQKFIPETLGKVRTLAALREDKGYGYQIEIDGGVHQGNLHTIVSAGVDIIVAGTAVFSGDIAENARKIKGVIENAS